MQLESYFLVTENRNTMPAHFADHLAADGHVSGVLWLRPNVTIGRVIEELYLIWYASTADEYQDRFAFVPL